MKAPQFVFLPRDPDDPEADGFPVGDHEEKVGITKHVSRDGRPWYEYKRDGYPTFSRRTLKTPAELVKIYRNDSQVRLQ